MSMKHSHRAFTNRTNPETYFVQLQPKNPTSEMTMVRLASFLHKSQKTGVSAAELSSGKSKNTSIFRKRRKQKDQNQILDDSSSALSSVHLPPSKSTNRHLESCLKSGSKVQAQTKRRRSVQRHVHWKPDHLAIEAPDNYCQKEVVNELWWTPEQLREQKRRGVKIVTEEPAANEYIIECKQSFTEVLPLIVKSMQTALIMEGADDSLPLKHEVHSDQARTWSDLLFTHNIMKGIHEYDYRGLERMTTPRKLNSRAVLQRIAVWSRKENKSESLADFARKSTQADRVWAHAIALWDAEAVHGNASFNMISSV